MVDGNQGALFLERPRTEGGCGEHRGRARARTTLRESRLAHNMYDVAPDGQSFFVVRRDSYPTQVHVIFNWFEELERLAPTDD